MNVLQFQEKLRVSQFYQTYDPLWMREFKTCKDIKSLLQLALIYEKDFFAERKDTFYRNKFVKYSFLKDFKTHLTSSSDTYSEVPIDFIIWVATVVVACNQDLRNELNVLYPQGTLMPNFVVSILENIRHTTNKNIEIIPKLSDDYLIFIKDNNLNGTIWDPEALLSDSDLRLSLFGFYQTEGLTSNYNVCTKPFKPMNFRITCVSELSSLTLSKLENNRFDVNVLNHTTFPSTNGIYTISEKSASYACLFSSIILDNNSTLVS